jgi:hypothetical protein
MPLAVEEAAAAAGRAEHYEVRIVAGEHGAERVIDRVGDAGRFVEDEESGSESDNGVGDRRERDDARLVGQQDRFGVEPVGAAFHLELGEKAADVAEDDVGLALGTGDDDGFGVGVGEGEVERSHGDGKGFAAAAGHAEEDALGGAANDFGLGVIERDAEEFASEVDGIGGHTEAGDGEVHFGLADGHPCHGPTVLLISSHDRSRMATLRACEPALRSHWNPG